MQVSTVTFHYYARTVAFDNEYYYLITSPVVHLHSSLLFLPDCFQQPFHLSYNILVPSYLLVLDSRHTLRQRGGISNNGSFGFVWLKILLEHQLALRVIRVQEEYSNYHPAFPYLFCG